MKTLFFGILSLMILSSVSAQNKNTPNASFRHEIKVEIKGEKNKDILLAMHYGTNKYSIDTAKLDKHGKAEFKRNKALAPGMYLLVIDGAQLFDFLISDTLNQSFSVSAQKGKYIETFSFTGSPENTAFADFTRFLIEIQKEQQKLNEQRTNDSLNINRYEDEEEALTAKMDAKVKELGEQYPGTLLVSVANAMLYSKPKASEIPENEIEKRRFLYEYLKTHYWDKLTLTDSRMQNTPILIPAIDNYFLSLTPQIPDSTVKAFEKVMEEVKGDTAMTRFIVGHVFNKYLERKAIMGTENILVHIIDNYYLTGKPSIDDEKFLNSIIDYANKNRPSLIGKQAKNLKMESITGTPEALYDIDAPYTLVYIFEASCGHCKAETPKVYKLFEEYKDKGLAGFCIYNLHNKEEWVEYVSTNNFTDWINVWDPMNENDYRAAYSVYSVPQIFVLDKDKKIVGRGLDSNALGQLLGHLLKNK